MVMAYHWYAGNHVPRSMSSIFIRLRENCALCSSVHLYSATSNVKSQRKTLQSRELRKKLWRDWCCMSSNLSLVMYCYSYITSDQSQRCTPTAMAPIRSPESHLLALLKSCTDICLSRTGSQQQEHRGECDSGTS